jgi:hypothetical protein
VKQVRTLARRWPLVLFLSLGCGGGGDSPQRAIQKQGAGYRIYQAAICHRCHGSALEGGPKAPALLQLNEHFDAARLNRYLVEPDSMQASDPRLRALDERYTSFEMPSYAMLDSTARRQLVEFLLSPWTTP